MVATPSGRRVPAVARALRTEVLRGSAVTTGVAATAGLVYGVFVLSPPGAGTWGGTWIGLGVALRSALQFAGPAVVAGAIWAAGRDRRRGMGELLGSTARPPWQRIVLGWGAMTLGATAGLVLVWAVAAVLVARVASYDGGRVWHPIVAAVSVGTFAAVGIVIGRFVPWRGTAPVAAIVVLYVLAFLDSGQVNDGSMWLSPALPQWGARVLNLSSNGGVLEVLWFAALTGAFLLGAGARQRRWALLPAVMAAVVAIPLAQGPGQDRWPLSSAATREVCHGDAPRVCVSQVSAFLLDDLTARVDALWLRLGGLGSIDGIPTVIREAPQGEYSPDAQTVYLFSLDSDLRGRLEWGRLQDDNLIANVVSLQCDQTSGTSRFRTNAPALATSAGRLLGGGSDARYRLTSEAAQVSTRLSSALDAMTLTERRAWLGRYLTAARSTGPCDEKVLDALAGIS